MRYADAKDMVPIPCVIAGVELRPFCLGHHLLFKLLNLPFAGNQEADFGPDDMMLGVAVCGLPYEETLSAIHNGEWPKIIARWRKQILGPWWNPVVLDMDEIAEQFRAYLKAGYQMPPTWKYEGKGGFSISSPWESLLKSRLLASGYSLTEALNEYLPAAWYHYFTVAEVEAASHCKDFRQWRKVFFTKEDAEAMSCQN